MSTNTKPRRQKAPTVVKTVSLKGDLAEWADQQAALQNRNLSNFVQTLLLELRAKREAVAAA
jgi:hypothetical protein